MERQTLAGDVQGAAAARAGTGPAGRNSIGVSHGCKAQAREPSSTASLGTLAENWIGNGAAGQAVV